MSQVVASTVRTRVPPAWLKDSATVSPVAWEPSSELDCEEWIIHGERLGSIGRGIAWWIGDWVNYGNAKFGEKYSRAARVTGYDVQTLMNMAYVAARFAPERRRSTLSWSHHAEVSSLDGAVQENLLGHAEETKLSVRGLRDEVRSRGLRPQNRKKNGGTSARTPVDVTADIAVCPNCGCQLVADQDDTARSD